MIKVGDGRFKKEDRLSIQNGKEEMFSWIQKGRLSLQNGKEEEMFSWFSFGARQPRLTTFLD